MNSSKKIRATAATRDASTGGASRAEAMDQRTDDELGHLFGRGSAAEARQALGVLIQRHDRQLKADAFRLSGGNADDADELFGVFSEHLLKKNTMFDHEQGTWIAWARKVLRGCASGERRKRRTRQKYVPNNSVMVELAQADKPLPWVAVLKDEVAEAFRECLGELKDDLLQVFILRVYLGRTLAETSRELELGDAAGPAKARTDKAIKQIRNCMRGKGFGPNDVDKTMY